MLSIILKAQVGINTDSPKTTLDINGELTIRNTPIEDGKFYDLGINDDGLIVKKSEYITSYSTYLGYDPMASTHEEILPFTLEDGYIMKIDGVSIGGCYGVMVNFTFNFIGNTFIGGKIQGGDKPEVILTGSNSIYGTPLEKIANASGCTPSGHTLTLVNNNQIRVSFHDEPTYYPNAGVFVIYNFEKVKQVK